MDLVGKLLGFNPLQMPPAERVDGGGGARGVQPGTEVGGGSNPFASSNTSGLTNRVPGEKYYGQYEMGYSFDKYPSRCMDYYG